VSCLTAEAASDGVPEKTAPNTRRSRTAQDSRVGPPQVDQYQAVERIAKILIHVEAQHPTPEFQI
jgi:hypothetical protein